MGGAWNTLQDKNFIRKIKYWFVYLKSCDLQDYGPKWDYVGGIYINQVGHDRPNYFPLCWWMQSCLFKRCVGKYLNCLPIGGYAPSDGRWD